MKRTGTFISAVFVLLLIQSTSFAHREVKFVTDFGGKGEAEGKLAEETHFAFDKEGNVYVSDVENLRVQKFDQNGRFLMKISADTKDAGFIFRSPGDLAIGSDGSIYVLDWKIVHIAQTESPKIFNLGPCVHKFDRDGKFVKSLTIFELTKRLKNLELAAPGLDEEGNYALIIPQGKTDRKFLIAVDAQDGIYVLDKDEAKIYKIPPSPLSQRGEKGGFEGKLTLSFGSHGSGEGQFNQASDIDVDSKGNLYVADTQNHRIVKFDAEGKFVKHFGEYGDENGQLHAPFLLAIQDDDNLLVADKTKYRKNYSSSLVRREFDPSPRYIPPYGLLEGDGVIYKTFRVVIQRVQRFNSEGKFKEKFLIRLDRENPAHVNLTLKAIDPQVNLYFMDKESLKLSRYAPAELLNPSALKKEFTLYYEQDFIEIDIDNPDDFDQDIGLNKSDFDEDVLARMVFANLRFDYDVDEDLRLSLSNLGVYEKLNTEDYYRRRAEDVLGTFSQDDATTEDYLVGVVQLDASIVLNHEPYKYREAGVFVYFGGGRYDYEVDAIAVSNERNYKAHLWFAEWGAGMHLDLGRKLRFIFAASQGPPGGYFNYEYRYIDELGDLYSTGFRDGRETMVSFRLEGVF